MGEHFEGDGPERGQRRGELEKRRDGDSLLDLGSVHAVLDHPRRRVVVDVVRDVEVVTMRDLAAQIAARENAVPPSDVSDDRRRSVAIALHHVHVPKLVDAGVVTVGAGMDRIRPGPNADQVLAALGGLYDEFEGDRDARPPGALR